MKKQFFIFMLPAIMTLGGCATMMLESHVDDVHREGQVVTTDKIIGFTKDEKSGKWMLAGEKMNYLFSMRSSLAKLMDTPDFDKHFINSIYSPVVIYYKNNYGFTLRYDTNSLNDEQLRKLGAVDPDFNVRTNKDAFDFSTLNKGSDDKTVFIDKNANDQIERINKPFNLEIREKGTAYSKALYPLSVAVDIVTSPLQLLALPFVIPNLHQ